MARLAIITVSWNTRELLGRCIASIHESLVNAGISYQIVVVDNASHDGTPAMLRAEHPEVLLLESPRNLGFAGGNNLALRRILGERAADMPEYVLLLNPDTEVIGDAISQLLGYLEQHPEAIMAGPQLRYADGSPQPSRRRMPTRGTFFWESTPLEQRWPGNPWAQRYRCDDTPADRAQTVDWLVGAALMVRSQAIVRAGLLDAGFLMYSEELEWQQRLSGGAPDARQIVYLPTALITHYEGKSSEQAPAQRYVNFQRSRMRYAGMRYGPRFAARLRQFLRLAYGAELAIEATKWLLGHKRPLRAQRVGIYWRVLRAL